MLARRLLRSPVESVPREEPPPSGRPYAYRGWLSDPEQTVAAPSMYELLPSMQPIRDGSSTYVLQAPHSVSLGHAWGGPVQVSPFSGVARTRLHKGAWYSPATVATQAAATGFDGLTPYGNNYALLRSFNTTAPSGPVMQVFDRAAGTLDVSGTEFESYRHFASGVTASVSTTPVASPVLRAGPDGWLYRMRAGATADASAPFMMFGKGTASARDYNITGNTAIHWGDPFRKGTDGRTPLALSAAADEHEPKPIAWVVPWPGAGRTAAPQPVMLGESFLDDVFQRPAGGTGLRARCAGVMPPPVSGWAARGRALWGIASFYAAEVERLPAGPGRLDITWTVGRLLVRVSDGAATAYVISLRRRRMVADWGAAVPSDNPTSFTSYGTPISDTGWQGEGHAFGTNLKAGRDGFLVDLRPGFFNDDNLSDAGVAATRSFPSFAQIDTAGTLVRTYGIPSFLRTDIPTRWIALNGADQGLRGLLSYVGRDGVAMVDFGWSVDPSSGALWTGSSFPHPGYGTRVLWDTGTGALIDVVHRLRLPLVNTGGSSGSVPPTWLRMVESLEPV